MDERQARGRQELMARHREAIARRTAAELGGEEYRHAADEVARIEVEIALLEEPPLRQPVPGQVAHE